MESDEALAVRASEGSRAAFQELYRRYSGRVYSISLRMLGDEHQAHDLTQDVFGRAWSSLGTLDPTRRFAPWILKISTNRIMDELKRRHRWAAIPDGVEVADDAPRPEHVILQREEQERIRKALGRVPEPLRLVLVLVFQEQMSYEDIADLLGITVNLARVRLFRGLRRLQGELTP